MFEWFIWWICLFCRFYKRLALHPELEWNYSGNFTKFYFDIFTSDVNTCKTKLLYFQSTLEVSSWLVTSNHIIPIYNERIFVLYNTYTFTRGLTQWTLLMLQLTFYLLLIRPNSPTDELQKCTMYIFMTYFGRPRKINCKKQVSLNFRHF